jgi:gliding motility-associated-like protein
MKLSLKVVISTIITFFSINMWAQPGFCPLSNTTSVSSGPDTTVCSNTCVTLTASNATTTLAGTTTYTGTDIPYNPFSYNGTTNVSLAIDDIYSGVINLPFTFCFFGQTYNQCIIGSNGQICFNTALANQFCPYQIASPIPANNNNSTKNCIMSPYYDMYPFAGGSITTAVYGTAPCRQFVVSFNQVPMYSCTAQLGTQQIVLYESTNIIDINVGSKPTCNSSNSNRAILGIENVDGSVFYTAPGKNGVPWTATNFSYRFLPNAAPSVSYAWYNQTTNANIGSGTSVLVCPTVTTSYKVVASFTSGCATTTAQHISTVTVGSSVSAAFTKTIHYGCAGDTVIFSNNSTGNPVVTWWSFGDGNTSNAISPTHIYNVPGIYTIKLAVSSVGTCTDTLQQIINTLPPSGYNASFNYTNHVTCTTDTVFFNNTSTLATRYLWNFGDGNTDTAKNPYHIYSGSGTFTVNLYTFDSNCRKDTATISVTIAHIPPIASYTISPDTVCLGLPSLFTSTSQGGGLTYEWTFGDGMTGVSPFNNHNYFAAGLYNTKMVITDSIGCKDSATKTALVLELPITAFTFNTQYGCSGDTVTFTNNTTGNPAVTWWSFGDGTFSNLVNPIHIYANPGIYTIKLAGVNGICTDTSSQTINTLPTGLNASFNYYIHHHCDGDSVFFVNTSTGSVVKLLWNLGTGTDSVVNPVHYYPAQGTYNITLITIDANCRKDTATQSVTLTHAPLAASFTTSADTLCSGQTATMTSTSTGAGLTYAWNFGDNTNGAGAAPNHVYTTSGVYTIKLVITDSIGCKDSATKTVVVGQTATVNAGPDVTTCPNDTIQLHAIYSPTSPNFVVSWTPATSINNTSITDPVVSPTATTTYTITISNTLAGTFCKVSDDVVVTVLGGFNLISTDTTFCKGVSVNINASGDAAYTYTWTPNTGVSNIHSLTPTITPDTSGTYTLVAAFPGCHDSTQSIHFTVHPTPVINVPPTRGICKGDTIHIHAQVGPSWFSPYLYNWFPTGQLYGTNFDTADVVFLGTVDTTIFITATTPIGCSDTDSVHLVVYSYFSSIVSPPNGDTSVCPGVSIPVKVEGSGVIFRWTPSLYLSDSTSGTPTVTPVTGSYYTLAATDIHGCTDTLNMHIGVYPLGIINLPDSAVIYPTKSVMLNPTGNCTSITWTPSTGLSNTNTTNPIAQPDYNTMYIATGTTDHGCPASDSIYVRVASSSVVGTQTNAFAPGSGVNSTFKLAYEGLVTLKSFIVYNRWGNKVFETSDIEKGWDGTYNGEPQPMGVYIYIIEGYQSTGERFYQQGNVTLIR